MVYGMDWIAILAGGGDDIFGADGGIVDDEIRIISADGEGDDMAVVERYLLSWGYWFSSRTYGLLSHPYITMREIVREHFLRPLAVLPVVIWVMSWLVAVMVGRMGLWFGLQDEWWTIPVGRGLVFLWVWASLFLAIWQVVVGYLYVRFRLIQH